jgi:alkylated DNA repair dioxygenase AlkB
VIPTRRRNRVASEPPRGFRHVPEFITTQEETRLLKEIDTLDFEPVVMRGVVARRQVVHFGWRYAYGGGELSQAAPIPAVLADLGDRATREARFRDDARIEALVTRYPPGAGIGWHRDAPQFGPTVVGVSLGSACELRLRLAHEDHYALYTLQLEPRALYVFAGTVRFRWQHAIPAVAALRHSVTFRSVERRPDR